MPLAEDSASAVRELRSALYRLRIQAGEPSTRAIARGAGVGVISHNTVSKVLHAPHLQRLGHLLAVVKVLGGDAEGFKALWEGARFAVLQGQSGASSLTTPTDPAAPDLPGDLSAIESRPFGATRSGEADPVLHAPAGSVVAADPVGSGPAGTGPTARESMIYQRSGRDPAAADPAPEHRPRVEPIPTGRPRSDPTPVERTSVERTSVERTSVDRAPGEAATGAPAPAVSDRLRSASASGGPTIGTIRPGADPGDPVDVPTFSRSYPVGAHLPLADELFLISHDRLRGRPVLVRPLGFGLAGAVLGELLLAGRIAVSTRSVTVTPGVDPEGDTDPVTGHVLRVLNSNAGQVNAAVCVRGLAEEVARRVGQRLAEAGLVARELRRRRQLWYPRTPTGQVVSPEVRAGRYLLDGTTPPDLHTALLIALILVTGSESALALDLRRRDLRIRMEWVARALPPAPRVIVAAVDKAFYDSALVPNL